MIELTKTIIDIAVYRNCLVYDADSPGKFSDRLLALMKYNYLSRNPREYKFNYNDDTLKTIFISEYGAASSVIWDNIRKQDVDIIITNKLGTNGELQKYYLEELNATLASNDTELVVGIGQDDVILGSF